MSGNTCPSGHPANEYGECGRPGCPYRGIAITSEPVLTELGFCHRH